jgi:SAM-dependent methyltransferase
MTENYNFTYTGIEVLKLAENNLINYNTFIVKTFLKHSADAIRILDFGAGVGTLSHIWKTLGGESKISCFEIDLNQIAILKERNFETFSKFSELGHFDYIFTSNVLEHIENDQAVLKSLYDNLIAGGGMGIFVPAHQFLYSKFDKNVEHFRRYSKSGLEEKITKAGFKIENSYFVDSIGFFAWMLTKIINLSGSNQSSVLIRIYDKFIWPVSKFLDKIGFKFLFGKNLLVLARKPHRS